MKLGKETASLINSIISNSGSGVPEVGKGMTRFMWTDRYAYEVIEVSDDKKTVIVQQYDFVYGEDITEQIITDLQPHQYVLKFRYGNWWNMASHPSGSNSKWNVKFGMKDVYRDPHF